MNDHIPDVTKMISDTPRTEAEVNRQKCWSDDLVTIDANFAAKLERELNAAQNRIKRLEDSYAAKDAQLSNLLHICRDNDIEVSSYDLIHGRKAK
ncbi:hypothetical protein UFOVP175_24 [uncultured Caudovirales phage]|uniref:Uncharacterized protein n=1 Tax=uncultured Caudovirales phage TaxID=2100421 RepID=A0A6J7WBD1_9CAUD|nr:hypothetical protein UFOVP175_24 [uncultured Caudovirales phage]